MVKENDFKKNTSVSHSGKQSFTAKRIAYTLSLEKNLAHEVNGELNDSDGIGVDPDYEFCSHRIQEARGAYENKSLIKNVLLIGFLKCCSRR